DVFWALRVDQKSALQIVVELIAQALDLIVLPSDEPVLEIAHCERIGQECLQLFEQRACARIVDVRSTLVGHRADAAFEQADQAGTRALAQQNRGALLGRERSQLRQQRVELRHIAGGERLDQRAL